MTSDQLLKTDRDIVASWATGWALSRNVAPPTPAYGGFRIFVGLPDQKARYVFAEASSGLREASLAIQEQNIFLKICAAPEKVLPLLARGWTMKPVSFMMTTTILGATSASIPDDYSLESKFLVGGRVAEVYTSAGELAASGRVFLVGETAVFDRIETDLGHRRRGLGRTIMSELARLAFQDGASTGALVATPDGRALYNAMGWQLHSPYTTAVRE